MEPNTYLDKLLIAYLLEETTAEQDDFIRGWLAEDPDNHHYFEQVKKTNRLALAFHQSRQINVEKEWSSFFKYRLKEDSPYDISESVPEYVPLNTKISKGKLHYIMLSASVAACLLVVVGLGWKYMNSGKRADSPTVAVVDNPGSITPFEKVETNNTNYDKKLVLLDGSEVTLSPNSELKYKLPFEANKRDLYLNGKAYFKVAKDKQRPFTIFSGDIATTALGTQFTVTAYNNAASISIKLFEGSVVINSVETAALKMKKKVFLKPGQELLYNNRRATAVVKNFLSKKKPDAVIAKTSPADKLNNDNPIIPLFDKGSWYMFNNEKLEDVFDELEALYNVDIRYNKKDVQKLYFIGKFNKSDSIANVLKQISFLNNLTLTKVNNSYILKSSSN